MSDPSCLCAGREFVIRVKVYPDGREYSTGRAEPCPVCRGEAAERAALTARLRNVARIPMRFEEARLDDFEDSVQVGIERALARRGGHVFVTVAGTPGIGKTHLLCATVTRAISMGRAAVYVTMNDLLRHLRSAYANNVGQQADEFLDNLRRCDVLALDEIDRFTVTEFAAVTVFDLLDSRYREGKGVTLLASNDDLASSDLFRSEHLSAPLRSRIFERGVGNMRIGLGDQDRRLSNPTQRAWT